MSLTCASSLKQVECQYVENADWREVNSLAKARLFANAIRVLLLKRPSKYQKDGLSMEWDMDLLRDELKGVTDWIDNHPDNTAVTSRTYADLSESRT